MVPIYRGINFDVYRDNEIYSIKINQNDEIKLDKKALTELFEVIKDIIL